MEQPKRQAKVTTIGRGRYLAEVPIEVVYAPDAPDEPIIEPDTARLLDEIARRAAAGDIAWI